MIPGRLETESTDYRKLRDELLEAEIALKDQRERVAALRRKLPLDTEIQDYEFHEGPADLTKDGPFRTVLLSELFDDPGKPLVVYQYMYGGAQKRPCPSCTMWVDRRALAVSLSVVLSGSFLSQSHPASYTAPGPAV